MTKASYILVVDDDPYIRQVFSKALRRHGYSVLEAETGLDGLRLAREKRPDLVILDVVLPDISGVEVCRMIKGDPALINVFVVLVSGEALATVQKVDGLDTGADDYLAKPMVMSEFLARIRASERLQRSNAALRASEQHYRRLVEILPDALALIDARGRITQVNQKAAMMLGYDSEVLRGKKAIQLVDEKCRPVIWAALKAMLKGGAALRDVEFEAVKCDGTRFPLEISATLSSDSDDFPREIVMVARDLTEHKRLEDELRQFPQRVIEAQEAERLRVARELHDGVNQLLATAKMRLRKVEESLGRIGPVAREMLARCNKLMVQALEENRRIAHNLRPSELDALGLSTACRNVCALVQSRTNFKISCDIANVSRMLPEIELNLFRILQEALTNIEKHAHAKNVHIQLVKHPNSITLRIQDDGCGFPAVVDSAESGIWRGMGQKNMKERTAIIGGTIEVASAPGQGTTITVTVPSETQTQLAEASTQQTA